MKIIRFHIFCLLFMSVFVAELSALQIDTSRIDPRDDVGDLYQRIVTSQFVVVGEVLKVDGITKRLTPELLEMMKVSLDEGVGGALYSIQIDEVVCRQTDFQRDAKEKTAVPSTIYVFLPRDEALFVNGQPKESFIQARRYLLFLNPASPQQVMKWREEYELGGAHNYYRTVERSRGTVPLTTGDLKKSGAPPVAEKVIRLCQAVRPPAISDKVTALKDLMRSPDSVLREEAEKALEALQTGPRTGDNR